MTSTILKPGDQIALICTGTPCEFESEPQDCVEYLRDHYQLQARYDVDCYQKTSTEQRANILLGYLRDETITAVWGVRGGEGSADLLPFLSPHQEELQRLTPKLLLGFSDFTPILNYFQQKFCYPTMHALSTRQLPHQWVDQTSQQLTMQWLMQPQSNIVVPDLQPLNAAARQEGELQGQVVGGNLSLVQVSLCDIWEIDTKGKIILLEELNEKPYKVARTLKYLLRIGFFNDALAVVLASYQFPDLSQAENQQLMQSMQRVFTYVANQCPCPVLYTDFVGHGLKNYPIPYYLEAKLQLGEAANLSFSRTI